MVKRKLSLTIVSLFLLLAILHSLTSLVYHNLQVYQEKFDPNKFSNLYNYSQFAQKPEDRKFIIRDQDLYSFAGWYYLTTGKIDTINIEHPPLGKYLIGISIWLFHNQNVGQIFWGVSFLILLFIICQKTVKNINLSLLAVLLFSQEAIFKEQLTNSLLDLSLGVFLLIFFLVATLTDKNNHKILLFLQGVSLGTIAGIKYPTVAFVCFLTLVVYCYLKQEKEILKKLFFISSISLIIFLLSYLPFFLKNPGLLSFYNLQIKALKIQLSHVPEYPKGQVFSVLFFNRWLSWWGEKNFIPTELWNYLWPILGLNSFLVIITKFRKLLLINLWTLFYLLFLSLRLFFPRYLFLLLPFFYLQLSFSLQSRFFSPPR